MHVHGKAAYDEVVMKFCCKCNDASPPYLPLGRPWHLGCGGPLGAVGLGESDLQSDGKVAYGTIIAFYLLAMGLQLVLPVCAARKLLYGISIERFQHCVLSR